MFFVPFCGHFLFAGHIDKNLRPSYLRDHDAAAHGRSSHRTKDLIPQGYSPFSSLRTQGFTLIEVATSLIILAVLAAMLVPLSTTLLDSQRASSVETDLGKIYTSIVGDPKQNSYGYLGDVGAFPASLMDLVQQPASNPPGWNGPYLSDARIDTGVMYDAFGSPIEYFETNPATFPAAATDQVALISRGPDRGSSNGAANPNVAANFAGVAPSNGAYGSTAGNADNVVYPHFVDNPNLVNYQSLGKLNINISNFDDNSSISALIPGCSNYFDVKVASIPRNATETWVNYNPGGASIDLIQGLYQVSVVVAGATSPIWQEQVAIAPDNTVTRNVTLPGINSTLTSTLSLTIANGLAAGHNLQFYQGSTSLGTISAGTTAALATSPNRCARILVRDASPNTIIDSFVMPNGPSGGVTRRYNTNTTCSMTFANQTYNTIAIYDDGMLIGAAGKRGNKRAKSLTVRVGEVMTWKDETNTARNSTNLGASYTVACPASTAQF